MSLFTGLSVKAQPYLAIGIDPVLQEKANAVIRENNVTVEIKSYKDVVVNEKRVVTVLNKAGMGDIGAVQHYDSSQKIKKMSAIVYSALGQEIAEFKRKSDFKDYSAVPGGTLYSDSRVKALEYTANQFPITVVYESEVHLSSTAFLPSWMPLEYYYASTEKSTFTIINSSGEQLKVDRAHLDKYNIKEEAPLKFVATNLKAMEPQLYCPEFTSYAPRVRIALERFSMEGVEGVNKDWNSFGKWVYDELLAGTDDVSASVLAEVDALVADATSEREKAKRIYEFMQNRSRYISVQVGIGGWKPILAKEVHKMGYGDCKGLSNYTRNLLEHVGIDARYAIIYGGNDIMNIDEQYSAVQGNHAVLYLPNLDDEQNVWLECTSKTNPFGYIANFTDDRDALVVSEEGGEIVHTTIYRTADNLQNTNAVFVLTKEGQLSGEVEIKSAGLQYAYRENLLTRSIDDRRRQYLSQWSYLNGLEIKETRVSADKNTIEVSENIAITVPLYATSMGDLLLIKPVILNRSNRSIKKYKDRKLPFKIDRGYTDYDEFIIKLSEGMIIDALPKEVQMEEPFGNYSLSYENSENEIVVKRRLQINKGQWDSEMYEGYRTFLQSIKKADNKKAAIKIL